MDKVKRMSRHYLGVQIKSVSPMSKSYWLQCRGYVGYIRCPTISYTDV